MPARKGPAARLTKGDWTAAALEALRDGGLAAVAVEPLAVRLGTTKGSFYWHFRDREELIAAALTQWEQEQTEQVIDALAVAPDPAGRLRLLAETTMAEDGRPDLSVTLFADADHPLVAAALSRVTGRRMGYLAGQFEALGLGRGESRARALLAYTAFMGHSQLRSRLPGAIADVDAKTYLDLLQRALLSDG